MELLKNQAVAEASIGAAKAKRDLERLLRASSSWDEPGRPVKP